MPRPQKQPLRPLTEAENQYLQSISRDRDTPAAQATRARGLLAVSEGKTYAAAARACGQSSGDTVANWVIRFNREGLGAVVPRHSGGRPLAYSTLDRERMVQTAQIVPDPARDGTHEWSLSTLRRRLQEDGVPVPSTYTLWNILRAANVGWLDKRPVRRANMGMNECRAEALAPAAFTPDAGAE